MNSVGPLRIVRHAARCFLCEARYQTPGFDRMLQSRPGRLCPSETRIVISLLPLDSVDRSGSFSRGCFFMRPPARPRPSARAFLDASNGSRQDFSLDRVKTGSMRLARCHSVISARWLLLPAIVGSGSEWERTFPRLLDGPLGETITGTRRATSAGRQRTNLGIRGTRRARPAAKTRITRRLAGCH